MTEPSNRHQSLQLHRLQETVNALFIYICVTPIYLKTDLLTRTRTNLFSSKSHTTRRQLSASLLLALHARTFLLLPKYSFQRRDPFCQTKSDPIHDQAKIDAARGAVEVTIVVTSTSQPWLSTNVTESISTGTCCKYVSFGHSTNL